MNKFVPQPVYGCSSCGGGLSNSSVQGARVTAGGNGGQNPPSSGVKIISSAPMPVAKPSTTRRTV